jgi:hypothetical protein
MNEDTEAERNSDVINRARNLELDTETESSRIMSGFIEKAWPGNLLKKIKVDNVPRLILTGGNLTPAPSFQLAHLEVKGMMGGHWVSLLDCQNQLKKLNLVLLNPEILQNVRNAIRRNSTSLEDISLTIATPNDMLLNEDEHLENNHFDIMFLSDCRNLLHLKLQNAPKIIDVSFLPLSLKSLNICGNVRGVFEYLSMASELRSLTLDICDGPIGRDVPPEKPLFSQVSTLKAIIQDTGIRKVTMSEMGAKQEYKEFMGLCEKNDSVRASLSSVEYKISFPEHDDIGRNGYVNAPRIKIDVAEGFCRRCEFGVQL